MFSIFSPVTFLMNVFLCSYMDLNFSFLFITVAGVVLCGGCKKVSPHLSIVRIIFYFWSFEIIEYFLKTHRLRDIF